MPALLPNTTHTPARPALRSMASADAEMEAAIQHETELKQARLQKRPQRENAPPAAVSSQPPIPRTAAEVRQDLIDAEVDRRRRQSVPGPSGDQGATSAEQHVESPIVRDSRKRGRDEPAIPPPAATYRTENISVLGELHPEEPMVQGTNLDAELRQRRATTGYRRARRPGMPERDRLAPQGTGVGGQITAHDIKMELQIFGGEWQALQVCHPGSSRGPSPLLILLRIMRWLYTIALGWMKLIHLGHTKRPCTAMLPIQCWRTGGQVLLHV